MFRKKSEADLNWSLQDLYYPVNGSDVKPNMKIGHFGLKNWAK